MLPRLLLLLAIIAVAFYSIAYIRKQPAETQKRLWWKAALIGGGVTLALLALTGKLHWIGILVAALVPIFRSILVLAGRALPVVLPWMKHRAKQTFDARSTNTGYLQFVVDKNGDMGGMITKGPLSGKQLKDITENQLLSFLQLCSTDRDSRDLLIAYINRYHPHLLRQRQQEANSEVPQSEAEQILGLKPGYSKEDIVRAHRSLMQRMHPDRGGSDYLAAKINAAKDALLKRFR